MTTMSGADDVYDMLDRRSFIAFAHPTEAARLRASGYVEGRDFVLVSPLPSTGMSLDGKDAARKMRGKQGGDAKRSKRGG